jgi:hypothetical protein
MKAQPTTKQLIEMLYERLPELFDRAAAQPAPVQEPETDSCGSGAGCLYKVAMIENLESEVERLKAAQRQWVGSGDLEDSNAYQTPPAQPAPVQELTNIQRHEQNVQKFLAAQPAVPDAFGTREGEHPQYVQGWNDCRAEMLKGRHEPV